MEEQLKKKISELEKRDKSLAANEQEVRRAVTSLRSVVSLDDSWS